MSLFIGGINAVLLELAEPRVRSGVWGHSIFPTDPLTRMRRTGLMTFVTIYAPQDTARKLIAAVGRMHDRVEGVTPCGQPYHAKDPVLLDWVQATASYGFMEAYARFVRPFTDEERDRYYAESEAAGPLYGAVGAPKSLADQQAQFEAMRGRLEPHPIVNEFLDIVCNAKALPFFMRHLQGAMIRGAVEILPRWVRDVLELGSEWDLTPREERRIRRLGRLSDRIPIPGAPPVQASRRMGLPAGYLYRG